MDNILGCNEPRQHRTRPDQCSELTDIDSFNSYKKAMARTIRLQYCGDPQIGKESAVKTQKSTSLT
ncbi:hypothetical protein BDV24DRAFT_134553 [Aspergillus arachidicola]|uniref:Uncharacterized protein n=1 Tax=Aspergillus arachidicola TaxID=656916 RepID=A0A5N6Y3M9_9EURO|nr:hypothetical protein BDV24DRAFT_134553 [Aspergillus arachidicola]